MSDTRKPVKGKTVKGSRKASKAPRKASKGKGRGSVRGEAEKPLRRAAKTPTKIISPAKSERVKPDLDIPTEKVENPSQHKVVSVGGAAILELVTPIGKSEKPKEVIHAPLIGATDSNPSDRENYTAKLCERLRQGKV